MTLRVLDEALSTCLYPNKQCTRGVVKNAFIEIKNAQKTKLAKNAYNPRAHKKNRIKTDR